MKKKILSVLLAVCLLVGALPMGASAASVTERENNNTMGTAQSISTDQFVRGNLSSSSDVDYYRVSLNSAGYISLTFNHEYVDINYSYWCATLYNSDNEKLASYEFNGHNTKNECDPIGIPTGIYYIKVNAGSHSSVSYELKLNYAQSSSWEKEFNNTFPTSNTIVTNSFVNGSLMTSSDVDYYKVSLSSAGYISLTFNHEYVDINYSYWRATLYNSDNKELVNYGFNGHSTKNDCAPIGVSAGIYYIKVSADSHSSVSYELKLNYTKSDSWEQEFNDTFKTANKISINTTVNGSLMTGSDVDYYKVSLSSTGYVSLTFNHEYVDINYSYWRATLYNSNNEELVSYGFNGHNTKNECDPIGISAGLYYIKINAGSHSDVKYSFKLSNDDSTTDPDPIDPTPSNVAVTSVSLNKSSLELKKGETASLTATVKPTNATNKNLTWSTSNSAVATVTSSGTVKAVSAGTAIITVKTSDGGYTARCTVTVTADGGEEPEITHMTINGWTGGITYDSSFGYLAGVIVPDNTDRSSLKLKIDTTNCSEIYIENANGNTQRYVENSSYSLSDMFYINLTSPTGAKRKYTVYIWDESEAEEKVEFSDVPTNAFYYDAVQWAVANGITSGTGGGKFSPKMSCTRAQAVTFLWRAAGKPEPAGGTAFTDVKSGSYYEKAVRWAVENGVTSGTGGGKFSPDATCDRSQIVTFLWRAEGKPSVSSGSSFSDVKAGSFYETAVQWAVANNITSGTGGGKFSPAARCDRSQIVTFLYRYYN